MTNYIGLDHHQRFTQVAVVDEKDTVILECRIPNTEAAIQGMLQRLQGPREAVLEAGASWGWMYDTLERFGVRVVLANPLQVRVIAQTRCKTDRRDAVALARLLRAGWIPKVYVGSREDRLRKQVWRERVWLVRMQVRLKSRIRRLLVNHHVDIPEFSDLFGKAGLAFLGALQLPGVAQKILETEMRLLKAYQEQIQGIQKEALAVTAGMPAVEYLKSLPGLGQILAPIAALEIGDIRRFRNAGSFASYCGLVPSVHASGDVAWHGTTQHSGNHWLKWVFVEAAWVAIRSMPELQQRFSRLKQRRGVHVAIVACARHLSEVAYALLRQQRCFVSQPIVYA